MASRDTIELKYENDDEEEIVLTLPSKMEVCPECEGHGFTLREGLRGESFTASEFEECFEEPEDREEYFRYGGKYDQICDECKGKNVVPVVDESKLSEEQKKQYEEYQEWAADKARFDAESAAERAAERRMGC